MNYLSENKKFSFQSRAVDKDTFGVVSMTGSEGLSQLYQFDITLIAEDANIDMDEIIKEPASFFIHRPDKSKVPFHGIIAEFDLIRAVGSFYLYRARLVPRLWRLTMTHHNQIFLNSTPRDIISKVLQDGGLSPLDFEFRLQADYVTWEYACQYRESHYAFICRWMEHNGIYFFFDQSGDGEKLIMTDSRMSHVSPTFGSELTYSPVSGLESMHLDESIQSYICRRQQVPEKVTMQDYNYRKPSLEVQGSAQVDSNGHGEMHFYGDHFRTPEEGNKLAKIRAEEYLCREKQFHGESTVPYLMPGYTFTLKDHFRKDMNRSYHTIALEHQGNQVSYLVSGIREHLAGMEQESVYRNSFTAIEDSVQFRARRVTERPRLHGTINGRIDAAGSGKYAELDDKGRYKVILPFDRSGRGGGKASAWVRMMQPYGGTDHGMHFPLHKGCEVLLSFIDGDPDRPVIAGAVANPEHPSQVTTDDQTMSKLTTSGGNKIHIEDKEGSERILLHSPNQGSFVRIGAHNDPQDINDDDSKESSNSKGVKIATDYIFDIHSCTKNEIITGESTEWVGIIDSTVVLGAYLHTVLGGVIENHFKTKWECGNVVTKLAAEKTEAINSINTLAATHTQTLGELNTTAAAHTQTLGEINTTAAEYTQTLGNFNTIAESRTRILARIDDLAETHIEALNELNRVAEQYTRLLGQVNTVAENKIQTLGELTTVAEDKTEILDESTTIAGNSVTVSESVEMM
jgi:type VI secretion system secreted protein VgrG